jgi:hypothetical protein
VYKATAMQRRASKSSTSAGTRSWNQNVTRVGVAICKPWRRFTTVGSIQLQVCTTSGIENGRPGNAKLAPDAARLEPRWPMAWPPTTAQRGLQPGRLTRARPVHASVGRPNAMPMAMPSCKLFLTTCCYYTSHVQMCRAIH